MSSVLCAGTDPDEVHINAVGVAPLTTSGGGTAGNPLQILDLPPVTASVITPTNFTFGNAQQLSYHFLDGKTMYFWWRVIFGTTSTFTTNDFTISIAGGNPDTGIASELLRMPVGSWKMSNAAHTAHYYGLIVIRAGGLSFRRNDDVGFAADLLVNGNNPLVIQPNLGNGVVFTGFASYEVP